MGGIPRIASLLPSATEIVCALGLGERLVGVSHERDSSEPGRMPSLAPQVIGTQDQCEVCAVSLDDVNSACKTFGLAARPCGFSIGIFGHGPIRGGARVWP